MATSTGTGLLPQDFKLFSVVGIAASLAVFLTLVFLYTIGNIIYNIWFHPLSHIPGPKYAAATQIPYARRILDGNILPWIQELHKQYGDVVRYSPTDVSFISAETAWQDIYGFRTGKHKTTGPYLKDLTWYPPPVNGSWSVIGADEAGHSRQRRNVSHAFSDKALREQEGILQGLIDLLVSRLDEHAQEGKAVDIMRWYNYTTFDVIADLTFGEPLYCLRDQDYHPWVNMVFQSAKAIGMLSIIRKYPLLNSIFRSLIPKEAVQKRAEFFKLSTHKVSQRLEGSTERPDFFSHILKAQGSAEKSLTRAEMDSNAVLFLIAGSETTATMLSGTTYFLLKNPETYSKLTHEIRSRFKSQAEITMEEVNKLDYMIACLSEGLRMYPPVPTGFPRVVPKGGNNISGHYIPEGTSVCVSQHATNHSSRNYSEPDSFIPERWLGDARFENDNRATFQPFSFGPRNCLGKNLAYAEMRLILAKVLWNFDLKLVDKKNDWADQKVFTLWQKDPLMVKLTPVQH